MYPHRWPADSFCKILECRYNPKIWDSKTFANSVDLDQMLQIVASDEGLHGLSSVWVA